MDRISVKVLKQQMRGYLHCEQRVALFTYCLFSVWPCCKKAEALLHQRMPLYSRDRCSESRSFCDKCLEGISGGTPFYAVISYGCSTLGDFNITVITCNNLRNSWYSFVRTLRNKKFLHIIVQQFDVVSSGALVLRLCIEKRREHLL